MVLTRSSELAAYFCVNPAWERIFHQLKAKWETYGRPAGTVILKDSTPEERKAVSGLLGKAFPEGELRFTIKDFLKALENSRFAGADYHEMLEAYFGEPITTRTEKKENRKSQKDAFYRGLRAHFSGNETNKCRSDSEQCSSQRLERSNNTKPENNIGEATEHNTVSLTLNDMNVTDEQNSKCIMVKWIDCMLEYQQFGYKNIEQLRSRLPFEQIIEMLDCIEEAEGSLSLETAEKEERESIPLAVLAANVSGDPHYLDRGSTAGTLFLNLLCFEKNQEYPRTAQQWKSLLLSAGIQPDEISSTVMTYGVHIYLQEKKPEFQLDRKETPDQPSEMQSWFQRNRKEIPDQPSEMQSWFQRDRKEIPVQSSEMQAEGNSHHQAEAGTDDTLPGAKVYLHPGIEAFCQMREPLILSTMNLDHAVKAYSESGRVYLVENEMVFAHLVKQLRQRPEQFTGALLCTSGQLRTASWELLKLFADSHTQIYYSGDLDPEGMDIADRIWKRWPGLVRFFCMKGEDYLSSLSDCQLSESRLTKLDHLQNPLLKETSQLVKEYKRAGYQENILNRILETLMT